MKYNYSVIKRTFEVAKTALSGGERPVSAILVLDNEIVAEATDAVFRRVDPTAHAERVVISDYCKSHNRLHLRGFELYCFIEPCLMCCGAIHWAKLDKVIYCLSQQRLKELSGGREKPGIRDYLPVGGKAIELVGPVHEEEAFEIARRYSWQSRSV